MRNNKIINFILEASQIVVVFLGVISALLCTATSLELTFDRTMLIVIILLASILFYGLFSVLETFRGGKFYGVGGITLFGVLVIIRFYASVKKGVILIINGFLKEFMNFTGSKIALLPNSTDGAGVKFCTSMVLVMLGIYLVAIISAFFYRKRRSFVFLIATMPFVVLPLFVGRLGYFSNLFTYLIVAVTVYGTRHLKTDASDRRMRQKLSLILLAVGLLVGAVSWAIIPPSRYERNTGRITQVKNTMVALTTWDQEEVFSWVKSYFNEDAIDYGKIGKKDEIHYTGETLLKISGKVNENHGMYLRGYVGDVYSKNKWKSLLKNEEYEKELEPLARMGITPDNWHMQLRNELGEKEISGTSDLWQTGTLRIRNLAFGYGNYVVPYVPTSAFKSEKNGRTTIDTLGIDYTVEYFALYPYVMRRDLLSGNYSLAHNSFWAGNEAEREQMTEFVEKYYLDLPDSVEGICDDFKKYLDENGNLYEKFKKDEADSKNKILKAVKTYITQDTEYSLSPGHTPSKKEAVEYFLKENKKGYCTYYATAAAVLLRSVGIPTRYVEGMYVPKEELQESVEKSSEIEVKDHDAHAWVEVFDEKYGFVPLEVTPGVGEDDFSSSSSSSGQNNSEPSASEPSPSPKPDQKEKSTDKPDTQEEKITPTPNVTQEPEESMIFDDIDGNEAPSDDGEGGAKPNKALALILKILIGVVGFILIVEGQRRLRRYLYHKNLSSIKIKKRIRKIHYHFVPVFIQKKVVYRSQTVAEYSGQIAEAIHVPEANAFSYVEMVFRARFGPDDITKEQYEEFYAVSEQMRSKLYEDAKFITKIYYMYIMIL